MSPPAGPGRSQTPASGEELMPRGPRGEKRPADVIGAAVMVAKIATGEIIEAPPQESAAAALGRKGGKARAEKIPARRRKEIARPHALSPPPAVSIVENIQH